MKNTLITLALLIAALFAKATNDDLKGLSMVHGSVQSEGQNLPYVTVFIKGTNIGTTTDIKGYYVLNLQPGNHIIRIQGVGYKAMEQAVEITEKTTLELNVELDQDIVMMDQVTVTGSRIGILRYLPGSANVLTASDINQGMFVTNNEAFRLISGIHTVEEEGAGLRANIGIRGLDPDKSRNVLMLEDGIPVALGPYGEPEMYYTPAMDRMTGIEVLKGNGQVLYGPQTIGGVINYITADPPAESAGLVSLKGGSGGYFNGMIRHGNTFGNAGYTFTYLRKQADNIGPTQFRLDDLSGKFRFQTGIRSTINIKWSIYNENSNATYVGLTQAMYDMGGMDDLRIAPNDNLEVRRYALSAAHDYHFTENIVLKTNVFGYTTTRNWLRQDFTYNPNASGLTGIWFGDADKPEGAIYMRNTTGNRNRQFEVAGAESRLRAKYAVSGITNQLDAGARFLYERAYEQRVNGSTADALSGILRNDEIRTGQATSAYAQNKTMLSPSLTLTGGLRLESVDYERQILRTNNKDTTIVANTQLTKLIPGAGINMELTESVGLYMGIHRGFAPPRIKDAISSQGEDVMLDAEKSWNYEFGARLQKGEAVEAEITLFYMDFSNQVIPVSESSGGIGSGLVNGGETQHRGVEASLDIHFSSWLSQGNSLYLKSNATWVESFFSSDRFVAEKTAVDGEQVLVNINGNSTPYAPALLLNSALYFESSFGLGAKLSAHYTSSQFTDQLNTKSTDTFIVLDQNDPNYSYVQATANGRIGEIPAHFVMNAGIWYRFNNSGFEVNAAVKNLLNERYIVSRRPQGIRVGLPRFITAGGSYSF